MPETTTPRRGRGRRPAAEVRAEILAAAGEVLLEEGLRAVTFERVAKEAGASRTTLHKWWPSPGALAAEAYFARSAPALGFADTGDLRADLVAQLTSFVRLVTAGGAGTALVELVGAAQIDPDLGDAWSRLYSLPRRRLAHARLRSAQQQGQLRDDADLDVVVDQLWGACYHRLLVLRVPLEEELVPRLVDQALRGAAPQHA